jgi:hypothetical protein
MNICACMQSGSKADKNLRFLLQKVLKQSDVGNLGRIVLPKVRQPRHHRRASLYPTCTNKSREAIASCACMHPLNLHMCSSKF